MKADADFKSDGSQLGFFFFFFERTKSLDECLNGEPDGRACVGVKLSRLSLQILFFSPSKHEPFEPSCGGQFGCEPRCQVCEAAPQAGDPQQRAGYLSLLDGTRASRAHTQTGSS